MEALFCAAVLTVPWIAPANILWGLLLIESIARKRLPPWTPLFYPVIFYLLASLASVFTSLHPLESLVGCKELFNFAVFPLSVYWIRNVRDRTLQWIFIFQAFVLSFWGFAQYFFIVPEQPEWRIRGPLSHYMTFAGILLLLTLINLATTVKSEQKKTRVIAFVSALSATAAILLSLTRNAWIGLAVGIIVMGFAWRKGKAFLLLLVLVVVFLVPGAHRDRLLSMADLSDPSNNDRLAMIKSGWEMFQDHPLTGVGMDQVKPLYAFYRQDWSTRLRIPHLHNNVMQIMAERGVFGLIGYVMLVGMLLAHGWKQRHYWGGLASLSALAGITAAGLFEWNFGDTEVLMMTLVAAALPFTGRTLRVGQGTGC